jgi:hypothetical protein
MHYEPLKSLDTIKYMDEGFDTYSGKWERFPNHMVGLPLTMVKGRRPVADTYDVTKYAQAQEGDRIGPFCCTCYDNSAARFAYQIRKTHHTHEEFAREGVYLVVNRTYKEEV